MHFVDRLLGKTPGRKRSPLWRQVRQAYLDENPSCDACGGSIDLEVHHVIPFHQAPELELEPDNLMVLCSRKKYGLHCHLFVGHRGNYRRINLNARQDAADLLGYLTRNEDIG